MDELSKNSIIDEIQNEYKKIDDKWLKLHYHTLIGLFIFGIIIELMMGFVWYNSGNVKIEFAKYFLKYILSPFLLNFVLVVLGTYVMRFSRFNQRIRMYVISFLYVGICFVFYMVHIIFFSLYLIFTVPMLMTVIYSDYKLTTLTAILSIAAKSIAELFIVWDIDKVNLMGSNIGTADFIISLFILCVFYIACMIVIRFEKEKNAASIQKEFERYQIKLKLNTDELTGIANRRALRQAFQDMEEDGDNSYIFVMIDIDNFKLLNDTFGHAKGDQCLTEFADILKKNCTEGTIPFRFGGDEFCILFKNSVYADAVNVCGNIQNDLKDSGVSRDSMLMTASLGISAYEKQMTAAQLLRVADTALYRAKDTRDAIYVHDSNNQPV
jgi:diguanylate cyclase